MSPALALLPGGLSRNQPTAEPARLTAAQMHEARKLAFDRAREEEARQDEIDTAAIGPWFADLERAVTGEEWSSLPDTTHAKVIRTILREAGVKARVNVRRYSMASGLSFAPPSGSEWSDRDAEIVSRVFPGVARQVTRCDYETDTYVTRLVVDPSLYPRARHDRSDSQADYHNPGGFRVGLAYSARVAYLISCAVTS